MHHMALAFIAIATFWTLVCAWLGAFKPDPE